MNRIEAIRIFNLVLDTVRRYEAEMGAAQSAPMNFDESRGGGVGRIGNHKPEYVAWFALCGKRALLGTSAGGNLLALRLSKSLSLRELSELSGVDRRQIRQAELGDDIPLSSAHKIASVLGFGVDELFINRAADDCMFARIAYTIFYEHYVKNRSELEALKESGVNRETFGWYLVEIAVRVAPELVKHGLYTQQLRGEMVEQDLEAMGRR